MKIFLVILLFTIQGTVFSAPGAPASGRDARVSEAFSLLASDRFLAPNANDKLIFMQGISKLNAVSHPIDFTKLGPKANATLGFLAMDPMKMLPKNEAEYRNGDVSRAAYSTRRIMKICSECHAGSAKPAWNALAPTSSLTLLEWGEFFKFASRPDDALLHYEKTLNAPGLALSQPSAWERAALNIVALGIESSSNAYTYVDLISNSLAVTKVSPSQKALLSSWRSTGKAWGAEPSGIAKPADLLTHARQLMTSGDEMNRRMPLSGFVNQSRAMLTLRKVIEKGGAEQRARAFFMSGELREKLNLDGVWLHAEDYYEACVRVAPKGSDAAKCLSALQSLPRRLHQYALNNETVKALSALIR